MSDRIVTAFNAVQLFDIVANRVPKPAKLQPFQIFVAKFPKGKTVDELLAAYDALTELHYKREREYWAWHDAVVEAFTIAVTEHPEIAHVIIGKNVSELCKLVERFRLDDDSVSTPIDPNKVW